MQEKTPETPPEPLTRKEALRLIWQADYHPILGNEDWKAAARLDREALARAEHVVAGPDGWVMPT